MNVQNALIAASVAALIAMLPACQKEGPAERAGRKMDNAAEKAGRTLEKAGEAIQDAAKGRK